MISRWPTRYLKKNEQHIFFQFGGIMNNLTNIVDQTGASLQSPVLVIIQHLVLTRTCLINILKREFADFEILELATTADLDCVSGRDVRLVALDIGDRAIADPSIEEDLALLAVFCPNAFVALLSNRDDEGTAMAAMQRGVRGFFPTSIPVEVAIAGLRLVLAGGVYRPLPIIGQNEASNLKTISADTGAPELPVIHEGNGTSKIEPEKTLVDLTPRERHVLDALKL